MLRKRIWGLLLLAVLVLLPGMASAQTQVPPVSFVGPLSHIPYDSPGIYTGAELLYWATNQPLRSQTVAIRGFRDINGSVTGTPMTFVGSSEQALNVEQLTGSKSYQPGWDIFIGYRFQGGVSVELGWRHLVQARYTATAALISPSLNVGNALENTFLYSEVVNFPGEWNGNAFNFFQGTAGSTAGIWNAATFMQIDFTQRFDTYELKARIPYWDTADYRSYGIFGPRIAWIWDRFRWRTVDADPLGNAGPDTTAIYSNTISNRMYGIHCGAGNDWFLGSTPIGGFAISCEVEGSLYLDLAKTRASYALADGNISSTRSRRHNRLVPGAEGRVGLWWYPWEGITMQLGYDVMAFFNTVSSHRPIDFNLGTVDPEYNTQLNRWFYGLRAGITFVW